MSFRTMQLKGMTINNIQNNDDKVIIEIGHAFIIKNMDDAEQDTMWKGFGNLIIEDIVIADEDNWPEFPVQVISADLKDNQMTYRDETLIPINVHGNVGITIQFDGCSGKYRFIGERMSFDVAEHEKYIKHIETNE